MDNLNDLSNSRILLKFNFCLQPCADHMTVVSEPTWSDLVTLMHNHTQLLCTGVAKLPYHTIYA